MKLKREGACFVGFYNGKTFSGNLKECLLFSMGFGSDQAASLRFEFKRSAKWK